MNTRSKLWFPTAVRNKSGLAMIAARQVNSGTQPALALNGISLTMAHSSYYEIRTI